MRLRPDDDIYRAKLLFLGPKGFTLPVHLPYVAYPLFAVVLAVIMFLRWVFTRDVELFPAIEIALSIVTTSVILRQVSPDRPVRAVLRTAATDWRRDRASDVRGGRARSKIVVRETIR
ncbi:hypothetical protein [Cryptosporangium phraense]|uniref:Uncharacterized protein n=1 Tax=Cryptosporangium phraense TaxID=2593070 RepID=A0A545AK01_9ACTN|nr:hypothetical protein [Cryptosporangium phraense]TQS41648.1 hypothetical protein FL583_28745 [Cryptosporangium phraense]